MNSSSAVSRKASQCTSNSRTRSSSMCAKRHRCLQSVHAIRQAVNFRRSDPRQRRPADRVCATSIPRNDQAVQVGWCRCRLATSATG